MKKFINDYLQIIANTIIVLMLMVASFYLMINYYHMKELKGIISSNVVDSDVTNYKNKLSELNSSLNKNYNSKYSNVISSLRTCSNILSSNDFLENSKTNFGYYEIYDLGNNFQNNIINNCYTLNLKNLEGKNSNINGAISLANKNIENINYQVNFTIEELKNNSSYFYTTDVTSATVHNSLVSDYNIITNSYIELMDTLIKLSDALNNDIIKGDTNEQDTE